MNLSRAPAPRPLVPRRERRLTGQAHFVTLMTWGRRPLFADPQLALVAGRAMEAPGLWSSSHLLAWVLMPDHWHGLLLVGTDDALSLQVQRLKGHVARELRSLDPSLGQVWTLGFDAQPVESDRALVDAARTLVCSPVNAGLVRRVGDYPYWNAVWVELWESGRELRRGQSGLL